MSLTLYGIPNCDTVKKARAFLQKRQVAYRFHDYKKEGIDIKTLQRWCKQLGYEALLNQRGTTWRKLSDAERADINESKAISLMQANPSLIKRPVLVDNDTLLAGFNESLWQSLL